MRATPARTLATLVGLAAIATFGCDARQTPIPAAFYLPRHRPSSAFPLGQASGQVELRDKCLYLSGLLMIWPEDFRLGELNGSTVVVGRGRLIGPGSFLEVGGGQYDDAGRMPSPVIGDLPPCPGPYLWVSEVD